MKLMSIHLVSTMILTGVLMTSSAVFGQTEPPPCGYCADLQINKVKDCKAKVLTKKGTFCPPNSSIESAACDEVKKKEGDKIQTDCNSGCSCEDKVNIDGEDTYTFIVKSSWGLCHTIVVEVTVTYEGKGWRGTCKKNE